MLASESWMSMVDTVLKLQPKPNKVTIEDLVHCVKDNLDVADNVIKHLFALLPEYPVAATRPTGRDVRTITSLNSTIKKHAKTFKVREGKRGKVPGVLPIIFFVKVLGSSIQINEIYREDAIGM